MNIQITPEVEQSRTKRLRAHTHATHERLDTGIMTARPFENRERYGRFLKVQFAFHREIDALYSNAALEALLPDLAGRRRLGLIAQDLADLGVAVPLPDTAPVFAAGGQTVIPAGLGWLYVAEGSNLGAAFLLKEAAKLDLTETFGARHLAAAPEGRGLHWKSFTAALDALALDEAEERLVIAGAEAAFARVLSLSTQELG